MKMGTFSFWHFLGKLEADCNAAFALSVPLSILLFFNFRLTNSRFPTYGDIPSLCLCLRKVILLKKTNYRPVSLTSIVCKDMQHICNDQLLVHLVKHNLISKQQHGVFTSSFNVFAVVGMCQ